MCSFGFHFQNGDVLHRSPLNGEEDIWFCEHKYKLGSLYTLQYCITSNKLLINIININNNYGLPKEDTDQNRTTFLEIHIHIYFPIQQCRQYYIWYPVQRQQNGFSTKLFLTILFINQNAWAKLCPYLQFLRKNYPTF